MLPLHAPILEGAHLHGCHVCAHNGQHEHLNNNPSQILWILNGLRCTSASEDSGMSRQQPCPVLPPAAHKANR